MTLEIPRYPDTQIRQIRASLGVPAAVIIYAAIYISPVHSCSTADEKYMKQNARIIINIYIPQSLSESSCCVVLYFVSQVHAQEFSESAGDNQGSLAGPGHSKSKSSFPRLPAPHTIQSNPIQSNAPLLSSSLALMQCHAMPCHHK